MSGDVVVIAVGNQYRRDDGVGPAVSAAIAARGAPGIRVFDDLGDPCLVLEAWTGARLAIVVDAAVATPSVPGRIHRCTAEHVRKTPSWSSHGFDVAALLGLGEVLDRAPGDVVVIAVEVADTRHGVGLSPAVAAAVPLAVAAVMSEAGCHVVGTARTHHQRGYPFDYQGHWSPQPGNGPPGFDDQGPSR